jgi:hypothetical protein
MRSALAAYSAAQSLLLNIIVPAPMPTGDAMLLASSVLAACSKRRRHTYASHGFIRLGYRQCFDLAHTASLLVRAPAALADEPSHASEPSVRPSSSAASTSATAAEAWPEPPSVESPPSVASFDDAAPRPIENNRTMKSTALSRALRSIAAIWTRPITSCRATRWTRISFRTIGSRCSKIGFTYR